MKMRRLIKFGGNSFVVSIPKDWIEKNKLEKGDFISVDESREGLLLKVNKEDKQKELKEIVIDADNKSLSLLKTEIISAYLNNENLIGIIFNNLKTDVSEIKNILHSLSGLEIIHQTSTKIIAKDMINVKEVPIKTLIKRMDNITRTMFEDTLDCFDEAGNVHNNNIINRDEEVNRLHFLAYRIIRGALKDERMANVLEIDNLELHSEYTITSRIEHIADNIKKICKYLKDINLEKKLRDELKELFRYIQQSYTEVMKSYYIGDIKIALKIEETSYEIIKNCDKFFDGLGSRGLKVRSKTKKETQKFILDYITTAKITESMKEISSAIKVIARTILGGG